MYVDFYVDELFENAEPDIMKESFKRFMTKNNRKCEKYLQNLDRMFEENRIYRKVQEYKYQILHIDEIGENERNIH